VYVIQKEDCTVSSVLAAISTSLTPQLPPVVVKPKVQGSEFSVCKPFVAKEDLA
jgi:hypothetical protein